MEFQILIAAENELDLLAGLNEKLQLIAATAALPPMAALELRNAMECVRQLDMLASARAILEAQQCL